MHKIFFSDSVVILLSFLVFVVCPYIYFYHIAKDKFSKRIIMKRFISARKESIFYTSLSMMILLLIYYLILNFQNIGFFQFKEQSSLSTHILTIAPVIILNDAYFYWIHYLLHVFKPLKRFHEIHHQDVTPTPLSALSFHPVEALLNFSFYFLIVLVVPMTKVDFYVVYLYMLLNNTLGHLPLEFCPRWFYKFKFSSQLNAATHHIMHHRNGSTNFSLYYLFWDKLMNTISSKYYERFNEVQDSIEKK